MIQEEIRFIFKNPVGFSSLWIPNNEKIKNVFYFLYKKYKIDWNCVESISCVDPDRVGSAQCLGSGTAPLPKIAD